MASSDTNNFSSSSPHRLPTLSASQALQDLGSTPKKPLSTGLRTVDAVLQGRDCVGSSQDDLPGGIARGEITEIYGPAGVGKTAFTLQVSANVLHLGGSVTWVDASYPLVGPRLRDFLSDTQKSQSQPTHESETGDRSATDLGNFHHFTTPTLPHLLALLTHQSASFPPPDTSLIVVDSLSILFALAFPKAAENDDHQQTPAKKSDAVQWASSRRWAVLGDFVSKIGMLAATKNIAILITSQTTTRIRSETGAVLHPAITGTAWESGIGTRVVLFRDWMFQTADGLNSQGDFMPGIRFAGVTKAKGVACEGVGRVVPFRIAKVSAGKRIVGEKDETKVEQDGLQEVELEHADLRRNASPLVLPTASLKRKRGEIADSQSEEEEAAASDQEFGWADDDETLNAEGLLD